MSSEAPKGSAAQQRCSEHHGQLEQALKHRYQKCFAGRLASLRQWAKRIIYVLFLRMTLVSLAGRSKHLVALSALKAELRTSVREFPQHLLAGCDAVGALDHLHPFNHERFTTRHFSTGRRVAHAR